MKDYSLEVRTELLGPAGNVHLQLPSVRWPTERIASSVTVATFLHSTHRLFSGNDETGISLRTDSVTAGLVISRVLVKSIVK